MRTLAMTRIDEIDRLPPEFFQVMDPQIAASLPTDKVQPTAWLVSRKGRPIFAAGYIEFPLIVGNYLWSISARDLTIGDLRAIRTLAQRLFAHDKSIWALADCDNTDGFRLLRYLGFAPKSRFDKYIRMEAAGG